APIGSIRTSSRRWTWRAGQGYRSSASPPAKRTRTSRRARRLAGCAGAGTPAPARAYGDSRCVPSLGGARRRLSFGPRCTGSTLEGSTRAPVTPTLSIPAPHRRYDGLVGSVLLHLLLLGLLIHRGDRLWSATLAPGDPALPRGGGGGGGGGNRVAYITLPPVAPAAAQRTFPVVTRVP